MIKDSIFILFIMLPFGTMASSGLSVNQLGESLNSTWNTLLKVTNCNRPPPQDSMCIKEHHGKTITVKLFGESVNALILFETLTTNDLSGPVITQHSGFLIGPIHDYGYKVVSEKLSRPAHYERHITDTGLRVFAHSIINNNISQKSIELNKGQSWLDSKNGPWIYHWSALAKTHEVLKIIRQFLNKNY